MSMKNPSKKFVKKVNEMGKSIQENLSKIFSATVFGVGFVAPLMFANIAQAANYGDYDSEFKITITGKKGNNTYSTSKSKGVYLTSGEKNLGTDVSSIVTEDDVIDENYVHGIFAYANGDNDATITATSLSSINLSTVAGNDDLYGICARMSSDNEIKASVTIGSADGGKLGSISVKGVEDVFGISAEKNSKVTAYFASGTLISATGGTTANYGIRATDTSEGVSVDGLGSITVGGNDTSGKAYGVHLSGGTNNISFSGESSSISATSTGAAAYGIYASGGANNTLTGDATNKTTISVSGADGMNSAAVYVSGATLTLNNFDLSKGTRGNAYTIYAADKKNNVLNLDNSNLAGTIKSDASKDSRALTINFSGTSAWSAKNDDIVGKVNITNSGTLNCTGNLLLDGALTNNGTLNMGGTVVLGQDLTGTGTLNLTGVLNANSNKITQGNINITGTEATYLGGGTMTADSAFILGDGENTAIFTVGNGTAASTLTITNGLTGKDKSYLKIREGSKVILGADSSATSTVEGAITGAGSLTNIGTLTIAGAKLQVATTNNGILNPTGSVFGADITGTGTINFTSNFCIKDRSIAQGTITVAGGNNLYLQGGTIQIDKFTAGDSTTAGDAQGLYVHSGANTVIFSGENCSIVGKSVAGKAMGIFYVAEDKKSTSVTGLRSILAETTATVSGKNAFGINVTNKNDASVETDTFLVSFATDYNVKGLGTISAYSAVGENYGVCVANASTGKTKIENLKSVTAGVKSDNPDTVSSGTAYGIDIKAGINNITFSGENTSITVKSTVAAYGIHVSGGTTVVTGDADNKTGISVTGDDAKGSSAVYVTGGTLTLKNFDWSSDNHRTAVSIKSGGAVSDSILNLDNVVMGGALYNLGTVNLENSVTLGGAVTGTGVFDISGTVNANGKKITQGAINMDTEGASLSGVSELVGKTTISKGSLTGADNTKVVLYGDCLSGTGEANSNSVSISGSALVTKVHAIKAGYAVSGNANSNTVNITTSGTVNLPASTDGDSISVTGGFSYNNGNANSNSVTISNGTYLNDIYGGYARYQSDARKTDLTKGLANDNTVTICDQGSVQNAISVLAVFGGKGTNGASNNIVTLSAVNLGEIAGEGDRDVSVAGGCSRERGDASGNTVNISFGVYKKSVYGGWAADFDGDGVSGNAENNQVNISGGTFYGNIYAGLSEKGNTNDNTIIITGTTATYLGTSGTMTADSAVTLGDGTNDAKFTIGNGTGAASLTFARGLDSKAKSTLEIKANSEVILQGTSTLGGTISGAGKVIVDGVVSAAADLFTQTGGLEVKDSGDVLTLIGTSKTLAKAVSGAGKIVIDGDVSAAADLFTQTGGLEIKDSGDILTLTGGILNVDVVNGGTVNVNATKKVTISGQLNGGTFTVEKGLAIYNSSSTVGAKTVVRDDGQLNVKVGLLNESTTVETGGELYLSGGTLIIDEIKGAGTVFLKARPDSKYTQNLKINRDAKIEGTLDGSGSTIDMTGDSTNTTLTIGTLTGTTNLKIDVDMSDFTADKLAVGTMSSATVNLTSINITKDVTPTTLELSKVEENKISYVVDDDGRSTVGDGGTYIITANQAEVTNAIVLTNNYKYTFTAGTKGTLTYKVEAYDLTFKNFVEGTLPDYTTNPATLSLTADLANTGKASQIKTITLGDSQSNDAITVNLNGHNLTSEYSSTITINSDKTFNLNGGNETTAGTVDSKTKFIVEGGLNISGKTTVQGNITNNGKFCTSDTVTFGGYVTNNGTLNMGGTATLSKKLTGTGTLNVTGSVDAKGARIIQKIIDVNENSSLRNIESIKGGAATENKITVSGLITGVADENNVVKIYGGWTESEGVAVSNSEVEITDTATVNTGVNEIYGAYSQLGDATENKVSITSPNVHLIGYSTDSISVVGGFSARENGTKNTVEIFGGTYDRNIYGAYVRSDTYAKEPAYAEKCQANFNTVTIADKGDVHNTIIFDAVSGGKGSNGASNNIVTLSALNLTSNGDEDRDVSVAGGCSRERGDASSNTVTISSGVYKESVYGGWAADFDGDGESGNAENNKVNISGGTFYGNVYAGLSEKGYTSGNIITITGTTATYLGTGGTIKADSAVTLGDGTSDAKFIIGNGTDTVALTFASGLNAKVKSTLDIKASSVVTLQGTSTLGGTISGAGSVKNTGTLNASLDKFADLTKFENAGTLNLAGQMTGDINGSGTTILGEDQIINANRKVDGTLNANGKTINMQEGAGTTAVYSTLEVGALSNTANLKIDVNLNESKSDYLKIGAAGTDAKVNVTSVNVAVDATTMADGTITFADNVEGITYSVEGGQIATTTGYYTYTFTNGTVGGKLNYTMDAMTTTVKDFITGGMKPPITTFTLVENTTDGNTGTFEQGPDTLNIYVGEYNFGAEGSQATIGVGEDKTMNLNGKGGTVYTNWDVDGDLNTSGTINMEGQVTGDGDLNNSGTLTITADKLNIATTNTDGTINLGKGTLKKVITDGTLNITDDVTTDADNIQSTTNNVTEGKVLTLTGGTLSKALTGDIKNVGILMIDSTVNGKIDNDGILSLNSTYTNEDNPIDNDGTLNVVADNLKAEVANEKGIVNLGDGTLSQVITDGKINVTGEVTTLGSNLVNNDVTIESGKNLTLTDGTVTVTGTNSFELNGITDITATGKLTIDKAAVVEAMSADIFNLGIVAMSGEDAEKYDSYTTLEERIHSDEAKNFTEANGAIKVTAFNTKVSNLNFAGGSLHLMDDHYTLNYVDSAKEVLRGVGTTSLVMMGELVQYTPKGTIINQVTVDQIDDDSSEEEIVTYDQVAAATVNGSLLVGSNDVLNTDGAVDEVQKATDVTVRDTSATSLSVNQLNLQQKQDTDIFDGVVITNAKSVTVGGSQQQAGQTTELMVVSDKEGKQIENNTLKVVVGLTADTAEKLDVEKVGTLNIGNDNAKAENNYSLNGALVINPESKVTVKGQTNLTSTDSEVKGITLNDATLRVESGSKITTNGDLVINNIEKDAETQEKKTSTITGEVKAVNTTVTGATLNMGEEGVVTKIETDIFTLDDSKLNTNTIKVANVEVVANKVTVKSTEKDDQGKNSTLTGKITAGEVVMNKAEGQYAGEAVTLNVGNEKGAGVVSADKTSLDGNMLFLDPVFKDGSILSATNYATETTDLDGAYVVGRNSVLTLGSKVNDAITDLFNAADTQSALGKVWSTNGADGGITAAAYIVSPVSVTNGSLVVDGSLDAAPALADKGTVTFAANSLLMVDAQNFLEDSGNVAISGIKNMSVDKDSLLFLEGVESGDTYELLLGEVGVLDTENTWKNEQIKTNAITQAEVVLEGTKYKVHISAKEYEFTGTVASDVFQAMNLDAATTPAHKYIGAVTSARFTSAEQNANMNRVADLPEELGVMHNHFNVTKINADAVAKHLALNEHTQGKEIWAEAIHSKENISGLGLSVQGNSYDTQYNGTVVGIDLMDNGKTTLGAAITYIDGKATNAGSHNEGKYYGATLYGRTRLGKDAGVQYDINYTHSSNDMTLASGCNYSQITGDQKINSFSVGARLEQELRAGHSTSFVPHIGARWLRMKAGSFTNSLGNTYSSDAINSFIMPLGLSFKASMMSEGWKMSFLADGGYQWNTGDRDYRQHFSYNGAGNSFDVAFADCNSWYAGMGFEFNKKNFTAGVGYRYAKGESTRQDKWSVNLSWGF